MKKKFEVRSEVRDETIWVYTLSGGLFGSQEGYKFQNEVRSKVADGAKGIVIDLELVDRIDSSGIGILVAIAGPAYQNYMIRAQVSEGIGLIASIKSSVVESFIVDGVPPLDRAAAGRGGPFFGRRAHGAPEEHHAGLGRVEPSAGVGRPGRRHRAIGCGSRTTVKTAVGRSHRSRWRRRRPCWLVPEARATR